MPLEIVHFVALYFPQYKLTDLVNNGTREVFAIYEIKMML